MKYKIISILLIALMLQGCEYFDFTPKEEKRAVARVNDTYLYQEDINALVTPNTSKEDSTLIVNNYINRWATQQLMIDRAKLNINLERQEKFDKLAQDYSNQLYTKAYTDAIVIKQLDSVISQDQVEAYYNANKETFSLNETLFKRRYIQVDGIGANFREYRRALQRFNEIDKDTLVNNISVFIDTDLNDSVWHESRSLLRELPVLKKISDNKLSTPNQYLQLQDSISVYMIYIEDVRERGELAPLSYIEGTVRQIILNKRRQDLIKDLKTDLTKDAIKNKEFETYK